MKDRVSCAVLALLLTGCAATSTVQTVYVAVPVPCQAEIPARPAMPTEGLLPGGPTDRFVAAAIAEIERRQGYEDKLLAALEGCVAPLPAELPAMPSTATDV